VIPLREAVRRAQEEVRRYVPEGVSLVDELNRDTLPKAAISAVNLAEVISRLIAVGMPEDKTKEVLLECS
jgi:PIN domain nuclease of toxin-antitoxin system